MARTTQRRAAPQQRIYVQKASFRYAVDFQTSQFTDCDAGGCSGMCRCSKITRAWITSTESVGPSCLTFVIREASDQPLKPYQPSRFDLYCIQRLMVHHGCYDASAYDLQISGGLYGEEVGEVRFNSLSEMNIDISNLLMLASDHAKLMFVFEREYGFIAEIVRNTDSVELVEKELGNIQPSAGAFMLKRQKTYLHNLAEDSIVGVVLDDLLIDGNHRFSYLLGEYGGSHKATYINLFKSLIEPEPK